MNLSTHSARKDCAGAGDAVSMVIDRATGGLRVAVNALTASLSTGEGGRAVGGDTSNAPDSAS